MGRRQQAVGDDESASDRIMPAADHVTGERSDAWTAPLMSRMRTDTLSLSAIWEWLSVGILYTGNTVLEG